MVLQQYPTIFCLNCNRHYSRKSCRWCQSSM